MRIKKYIFIILAGILVIASITYGIGWYISLKVKKIDIPAIAELNPDKSVSL